MAKMSKIKDGETVNGPDTRNEDSLLWARVGGFKNRKSFLPRG